MPTHISRLHELWIGTDTRHSNDTQYGKPDSDPNNPWPDITPSKDLNWTPCYQTLNPRFHCARLTVPMDYHSDPSVGEVHIALVLLPSANSSSSQRQPLLLNPGGPGGSGTRIALTDAAILQSKVFGPDQPIIGFDPRGVGYTTPRADCWARRPPACKDCEDDVAGGYMHRVEWENSLLGYGLLNSSDTSLQFLELAERGVNSLCKNKFAAEGPGGKILKYAATEFVARDMLSMVHAWDRYASTPEEEPLKGKLVYWGFSYGTILGNTFAKMFPDKVGRVILDGVVHLGQYREAFWRESLMDTDKILGKFFNYCADAGDKCALYRAGDTKGGKEVEGRYYSVLESLKSNPVTFTHPQYLYPVILKQELVRMIAFGALKIPMQAFPGLAFVLNLIYEGRHEELSNLFLDTQLVCLMPGSLAGQSLVGDAQRAIMCSDKVKPVNLTLAEFKRGYEDMASYSQFADIWAGLMLQCNGWDISSTSSSSAIPSSPDPESLQSKQIETSFPILFLSNTYDPVTPLKSAVKMALGFKDAGLLELKAEGHCTTATVSLCTAKAVRDYVLHGKVPSPPVVHGKNYLGGKWTTCEADEVPWRPADVASLGDNKEERDLVEGFRSLRHGLGEMMGSQFHPQHAGGEWRKSEDFLLRAREMFMV
ncbi:TAP-like protein-domain-containing protein [Podospora australis]|uniref:TAP-like protein-domain-containing protein n=1 Tax=Podospora australis TaxID=1536484 RepID=A0AAN6WNN5_9PEZI|nr:TAP-like protein-domain-containing protein [Podospora australis]